MDKQKDGFVSAVRFPNPTHFHSDGMVVHFSAIVGNHTIKCAISLDALREHFAKVYEHEHLSQTAVFSRHRSTIEHIAERLIAQKRFENNGSILIRRSDC